VGCVDWAVLDTPIGPFGMLAEGATVWAAGFSAEVEVLRRMLPESRRDDTVVPCGDLGAVSSAVRRYLGGELGAIDAVTLAWELDGFRDRAMHAMRAVPAGATISYRELAVRAGSNPDDHTAARAAGQACARNPLTLFVPCHRIVASSGDLHNYGWGLRVKRWLLDHESNQGRLFD
jgi:methylated-DNA-[protein]-cysteine S-methyltransferase